MIQSDIKEALNIIENNHVGGKKLDYNEVVKSSIDTMLHALPLYHCAQLDVFLGPAIYLGCTNIITGQPKPDVILPLMSAETGSIDVLSVLDSASARLTTEALRTLMASLSIDGATPELVALDFTGNVGT